MFKKKNHAKKETAQRYFQTEQRAECRYLPNANSVRPCEFTL